MRGETVKYGLQKKGRRKTIDYRGRCAARPFLNSFMTVTHNLLNMTNNPDDHENPTKLSTLIRSK